MLRSALPPKPDMARLNPAGNFLARLLIETNPLSFALNTGFRSARSEIGGAVHALLWSSKGPGHWEAEGHRGLLISGAEMVPK
jgi:hypothetical protein